MKLEPINFTALRSALPDYLDRCATRGARYLVQRHSRGDAVLIGLADWEEIIETLGVLGDPALLAELVAAQRDIPAGRFRPAHAVFEDLLSGDNPKWPNRRATRSSSPPPAKGRSRTSSRSAATKPSSRSASLSRASRKTPSKRPSR